MARQLNPSKPVKRAVRVPGYGEKMQLCSVLQRKFIEVLFEHPELPNIQALVKAGYKGNRDAAKKMAERMMHNPLVQDAMIEYGATKYRAKLPKVVRAIGSVIDDPKAKDHVKVLHGLLDRVGMHAVQEKQVNVTHSYDRTAIIAKIATMLERNQGQLPEPLRVLTAPTIAADLEAEEDE